MSYFDLRAGRRNSILFKCYNLAPEVGGTPEAAAQGFELNNLAVVYEQIHLRAEVFYVPGEHFRFGGFKHDVLKAERVGELGGHICAPGIDAFRDAFGFDHYEQSAGIEEALGAVNRKLRRGSALLLQS